MPLPTPLVGTTYIVVAMASSTSRMLHHAVRWSASSSMCRAQQSSSCISPRILISPNALLSPCQQQQLRSMATKKAGGSSTNGRDSIGRRLGIKVWPNKMAQAGSIIVRQRGAKFRPGPGTGMGMDHTIFATRPGRVHLEQLPTNRKRHVVHVVPTNNNNTTTTAVVSAAETSVAAA